MPKLNRRRFLQVIGAAGLAPSIPAFPARAGAAAAAGTATTAQMLWASLYTRAGSAEAFATAARAMGLSHHAAARVYARIAQTHVLTAHGAAQLRRVARPAAAPSTPATSTATDTISKRKLGVDFDRVLSDVDDKPDAAEIEELDPQSDALPVDDISKS